MKISIHVKLHNLYAPIRIKAHFKNYQAHKNQKSRLYQNLNMKMTELEPCSILKDIIKKIKLKENVKHLIILMNSD